MDLANEHINPFMFLNHAVAKLDMDTLTALKQLNKEWSTLISLGDSLETWLQRDFPYLYDYCTNNELDIKEIASQGDISITALLKLLKQLPTIYTRNKREPYRKYLKKFVNDTLYKSEFDYDRAPRKTLIHTSMFLAGVAHYVGDTFPTLVKGTKFKILYWVMPFVVEHMYKTCMVLYDNVIPDTVARTIKSKCMEMDDIEVPAVIGGFEGYLVSRFIMYSLTEL